MKNVYFIGPFPEGYEDLQEMDLNEVKPGQRWVMLVDETGPKKHLRTKYIFETTKNNNEIKHKLITLYQEKKFSNK